MATIETPTIYELAKQVGVSTATVSRVLNGRKGIGEATRRRVLEAARVARYRPQVAPRVITVGLVIDTVQEDMFGTFVPALAMHVSKSLANHHVSIQTFSSGNFEVMTDRYLDAALAIAWEPSTIASLRKLSRVPVVIFNQPRYEEFSSVNMDLVQAGQLAGEHFWQKGHRRFGVLANKPDLQTLRYLSGISAAYRAHGMEMDEEIVGYTNFKSPLTAVKRLLSAGATGILLLTSEMTHEIPYLCTEGLGIRVPEELSFIGLDDGMALQFARPPMTVIGQQPERMADLGVELLLKQIESPKRPPQKITLNPQLIIRESVATLGGDSHS